MGDWLIHHELERQAHWRPATVVKRFEGVAYTYAEFNARVNRTARALRNGGVSTGDVVVAHGRNHVDLFTLFYACSKLGATYSTISTFQSATNVEYICETLAPSHVFYTADEAILTETLSTVRAAATAAVPDARFVSLDAATVEGDSTFEAFIDGFDESDPVWGDDHPETTDHNVFWTSGTTGRPKAVVRDHRASLHYADPLLEVLAFTPDTKRLIQTNMMYVAPYLQYGVQTVMAGGSFEVLRQFDPEKICELVNAGRATVMLLTFTQQQLLLEYLREHDVELRIPQLQVILPNARVGEALAEYADELYHLYVSTEVGLVAAKRIDPPFTERPAVGVPGRGADVRLADPDTKVRAATPPQPGDRGEIAVRGDVTMTRYLQEEPQREKVRDGWVYPGDFVRVNDAGELVFVGRVDHRLRSGGVNVYPDEVENVLTGHPAVEDAVVVGVPDEKWGERICALVVPADANADTDDLAADLDRFCRESADLARAIRPREYAFVRSQADIPTGALNKVSRPAVVERYFTQ
jgi:long-chain acyl-CoA synthetase